MQRCSRGCPAGGCGYGDLGGWDSSYLAATTHWLSHACQEEGSLLKMAASSSFIGSHTETNKMRSGMPRTHTALKEVVMYLSQEGRLLESQRPFSWFSSAWPTDFAAHVPPIS